MYDAMIIARYVVDYFTKEGSPITNLKLQKILYYLQVDSLIENGIGIFNEDVVAWRFGPVVESVYQEFRINGSFEIEDEYPGIADYIEDIHKESINELLERSMDYSAIELVRKTHEDVPWDSTEQSDVISREKIVDFYAENRNRML